ncbi:histone-lysine N-methyltransferase SETMAR [Trichonephila clavipes]|uniref:Histone-lysine N-methyltransferase SETMAR n=1 Tax=Trichonephila clavipes TaxID=2585209 RepID=A0A8X7BH51_TRICX|nr:histone-lysine N-methyltransferase SETMAR [Trichonephila clavipes]
MKVNKEKIHYILQFFFDKGENASQVAEIGNHAYGADTATAIYVQFWFRRFRSGILGVNDAPRTGRPVFKNVDKTTEIIEVDQHVSSRRIVEELKIDHKTVLNHLRKTVFKKKPDVWVPDELIPQKHDGSNFHLLSLTNRNKIDSFLKHMVPVIRNGSHTARLCESDRDQIAVKQLKRWPNQD